MSEQAVANESNVGLNAPAEESGAQDDLDALLAEYDNANKPVEEPKPQTDIKELVSYVQQEREEKVQAQLKEDVNGAVSTVKESLPDLPVKLSDRVVRGFLEGLASEDKRFTQAFENRHSNPKGWNSVLKSAAKELAKEFDVDPEATSSRESVVSAVKSASTKQVQESPELSAGTVKNMSDAEFNKTLREMGF